MSFMKQNRNAVGRKKMSGIVYLLIMTVDDKQVYKIGVTSRAKVEERVVEILTSHYHKYRHFCHCKPKRFRKTTDIYEKEKILHDYFAKNRYESELKFQGCTELFDIDDLDHLLEVYEKVLNGEELDVPETNTTE